MQSCRFSRATIIVNEEIKSSGAPIQYYNRSLFLLLRYSISETVLLLILLFFLVINFCYNPYRLLKLPLLLHPLLLVTTTTTPATIPIDDCSTSRRSTHSGHLSALPNNKQKNTNHPAAPIIMVTTTTTQTTISSENHTTTTMVPMKTTPPPPTRNFLPLSLYLSPSSSSSSLADAFQRCLSFFLSFLDVVVVVGIGHTFNK